MTNGADPRDERLFLDSYTELVRHWLSHSNIVERRICFERWLFTHPPLDRHGYRKSLRMMERALAECKVPIGKYRDYK